jgi:hypothetical protein
MGTFGVLSGRLGSLGALAVMIALGGIPPQSANPVVELIPAHPWPAMQKSGKTPQFPFHRTGNGVTLIGGVLKVPVATNCTARSGFCTVAAEGLTEIDTSVRPASGPTPQLTSVTAVNIRSVAESKGFMWHLQQEADEHN